MCVSREVGVGACEQASAPGSFSGRILAHRKQEPRALAYFNNMGKWGLASSLTKISWFV